jgi:hypothetical protein
MKLVPDSGAKEEGCTLLKNILLFLAIIGHDVHCYKYESIIAELITLHIQKLLQIRVIRSAFYAVYQFIVC